MTRSAPPATESPPVVDDTPIEKIPTAQIPEALLARHLEIRLLRSQAARVKSAISQRNSEINELVERAEKDRADSNKPTAKA